MENRLPKFQFYTDGVKTIRVKPGDEIPNGFYKGRTFNHKSWNRGKTKDDDPRIAQNGAKTKETRMKKQNYHSWNEGLTKETSSGLKVVSEKMKQCRKEKLWTSTLGKQRAESSNLKQSLSMKQKYQDGMQVWNKGLTKETDERVKGMSDKLLGHPDLVQDKKSAKLKEYETKKQNGQFSHNIMSNPEKEVYSYLIKKFGEDDIEYQYLSEEYPFKSDFYIYSIDTYIEVNAAPQHMGHPFNQKEKEDINLVESLKKVDSKFNKATIYTWTDLDVRKRETAILNNLNFIAYYPYTNEIYINIKK